MPIPAALNSSTATVLSNHLLVFTNSDALTRTPHFIEGSIQQLLFTSAASAEFFHPPAPN